MERLTFSTEKYGAGLCEFPKDTCNKICELHKCENCPIQRAFNKLAAYEDIGLSPDGVKKLLEEYVLHLYDQKRKAETTGGEQ